MPEDSPLPHPTDWPVVSLRDIALKIGSGATPSGGEATYLTTRSHFALVRSQNVLDRAFDTTGLAFISDQQAKRLQGVKLQPNDVLLNITGDGVTFSRACIVPVEVLPACVNQHVAIIRLDSASADSGFVLAFLTHPAVKAYIESFNAGGSRRAITKGHIESFRLALPPLSDQRAIAGILGSLDDKIDLNRRMNETLEALGRTLFKSWFVDFDDGHLSFDGRTEDTDLGRIPRGWRVGTIGEICDVVDCLHSRKPARSASGGPLLQLTNIRDDGLVDMADTYWIAEGDYRRWTSRFESRQGDCIITNVGRVGAVAQIPAGLLAALGRNMTGLRCKPSFPYPSFLIECLRSAKMKEEIALRTDTGTILDALNVRSIPKLRFVLGPQAVIDRFERTCRPIRQRMEIALRESRILAELRDSLLLKLLSGELRVKAADRIMANTI